MKGPVSPVASPDQRAIPHFLNACKPGSAACTGLCIRSHSNEYMITPLVYSVHFVVAGDPTRRFPYLASDHRCRGFGQKKQMVASNEKSYLDILPSQWRTSRNVHVHFAKGLLVGAEGPSIWACEF